MSEPTNEDRAERVRIVLECYLDETVEPDNMTDLLTDIMHFCHQNKEDGFDFAAHLRMASHHFNEETQ